MSLRKLLLGPVALAALALAVRAEDAKVAVLEPGQKPKDHRLGKPLDLNGYFPFHVPATREAWEARRQALREQLLVAVGLWPLPERTPLHPTIHGKIDRGDYTVEKVFFASYPGHYVSGNLYRPKGGTGKHAGVLCPHGHWNNGRFFDLFAHRGEAAVKKELSIGAEKTVEGARFPLQARCATLARMGCVVFHYDMVGNADSKQISHAHGFTDTEAELRSQNFMGLQTWNSMRALDFLLGLPDVDASRIGVTGASGGGTQTFMLCALDNRPAAAFPAVMVSTAMQGGCVCENCSYLRINTSNVEFAGLFAPKPLGMSGADDWTKEIETKGLPELRQLYRLYGAEDRVQARTFAQFEHNYNQVAREVMYNWFNRHLKLGLPEPVTERPFVPVRPEQLSVYTKDHPRPADATDVHQLRQYLTQAAEKQRARWQPKDAAGLEQYRRTVGTALRVMAGGGLPASDEVEVNPVGDREERGDLTWRRYLIGRKGAGEQIPAIGIKGKEFDGTVVIWVHPEGKKSLFAGGELTPLARSVLDKKAAIFAPDVLRTGESAGPAPAVNAEFAGYTYGYNRPLLADRVRDILTAVAAVKTHPQTKTVHLLGLEKAGPWALLARGLCGDAVARTAADGAAFQFEAVKATGDPMMLPGAVKFGGLGGLAALAAPGELWVHNHALGGGEATLKQAYAAGGAASAVSLHKEKTEPQQVVAWLLR